MKYRFQHFFDIATSGDSMQIINFNVGGEDVIKRCAHLFNAYKYFKLGRMSVKFVPASTLPMDPLGLSYSEDDVNSVDPRDQLNPGLVRITNGEDIFNDLTGVSADVQDNMYNAMLLDPRWYKFSLQSGFKRSATPLYWQIGQVHQDQFPGAWVNVPQPNGNGGVDVTSMSLLGSAATGSEGYGSLGMFYQGGKSAEYGILQTGHRGRLGFLPTDAYQWVYAISSASDRSGMKPMVHPAPCVRTITCVLPRAHKTIYYYRCYITETVYFSGLRSIAPQEVVGGFSVHYRGIDNFMPTQSVLAQAPNEGRIILISPPVNQMNDGSGEIDE